MSKNTAFQKEVAENYRCEPFSNEQVEDAMRHTRRLACPTGVEINGKHQAMPSDKWLKMVLIYGESF